MIGLFFTALTVIGKVAYDYYPTSNIDATTAPLNSMNGLALVPGEGIRNHLHSSVNSQSAVIEGQDAKVLMQVARLPEQPTSPVPGPDAMVSYTPFAGEHNQVALLPEQPTCDVPVNAVVVYNPSEQPAVEQPVLQITAGPSQAPIMNLNNQSSTIDNNSTVDVEDDFMSENISNTTQKPSSNNNTDYLTGFDAINITSAVESGNYWGATLYGASVMLGGIVRNTIAGAAEQYVPGSGEIAGVITDAAVRVAGPAYLNNLYNSVVNFPKNVTTIYNKIAGSAEVKPSDIEVINNPLYVEKTVEQPVQEKIEVQVQQQETIQVSPVVTQDTVKPLAETVAKPETTAQKKQNNNNKNNKKAKAEEKLDAKISEMTVKNVDNKAISAVAEQASTEKTTDIEVSNDYKERDYSDYFNRRNDMGRSHIFTKNATQEIVEQKAPVSTKRTTSKDSLKAQQEKKAQASLKGRELSKKRLDNNTPHAPITMAFSNLGTINTVSRSMRVENNDDAAAHIDKVGVKMALDSLTNMLKTETVMTLPKIKPTTNKAVVNNHKEDMLTTTKQMTVGFNNMTTVLKHATAVNALKQAEANVDKMLNTFSDNEIELGYVMTGRLSQYTKDATKNRYVSAKNNVDTAGKAYQETFKLHAPNAAKKMGNY